MKVDLQDVVQDRGAVAGDEAGGYVMSLDVGTSSVRCYLYERAGSVVGKASEAIKVTYPRQGQVEIVPDDLWSAVQRVCKDAVKDAGISFFSVKCLGISCQRNTFLVWDKLTQKPYHNLIVWNDVRSAETCELWNSALRIKLLRALGSILYFFTRRPKFLTLSILKFTPVMTVMKLVGILKSNAIIAENALAGNVLYGTTDTWLVWKLTGGAVHATDPSNACSSGMYDPFAQQWADFMLKMLNIPKIMLPTVQDTNGDFGLVKPQWFGISFPIRCVVGDQQAAMFGQCCFDVGDIKCTLGTGAFLNINTGLKPHASFSGIYPVIAWRLKGQPAVYSAECATYDVGTCIKWSHNIGLIGEPTESERLAKAVPDSNGVYFVPAFSGIQAPINDPYAACTLIGISPETRKEHMVRAILESIAFRVKQMYEIMVDESEFEPTKFCAHGGVAQNDFILQLIADLINRPVHRSMHNEMSSRGAAFLAGLSTGFWKHTEEFKKIKDNTTIFTNSVQNAANYPKIVAEWERAVNRALFWHTEEM